MKPHFDISGDLDTPVSAFMKLAAFQPRFLLESVEGGERLARYSFIGFGDCLEVKLDRDGFMLGGERQVLIAVTLRIDDGRRAGRLVGDQVRRVGQAVQIELLENHWPLTVAMAVAAARF